jgi:transposase
MAHARRPFVDLVKLAKTTGKSHQIVSLIQKLYALEKSAKEKKLSHEERFILRLTESKNILYQIKTWLDKTMPSAPPQSALGKGILYMQTRWDQLTAFLKHGMLEIDNNMAENAIRPFALGRKNWLFAATPCGAKASMLFYSLIMTCKANNIEPFAYFDAMLKRIALWTSQEHYEALLPYNITELNSDV